MGFLPSLKKCEFDIDTVEFLGYIISPKGIAMDPFRVSTILDWPSPHTVKQVQSFLGFCNFYRRFTRDYSKIARCLTDLKKASVPFKWTDDTVLAFRPLKIAFTEALKEAHLQATETHKTLRDEVQPLTGSRVFNHGPAPRFETLPALKDLLRLEIGDDVMEFYKSNMTAIETTEVIEEVDLFWYYHAWPGVAYLLPTDPWVMGHKRGDCERKARWA